MHARRAAVLLFAVALAASAGAATAQAPAPAIVRLASAPDDDVTPVLYAQSAGLFRAAGLDVEIAPLTNGSAVAAAVAGGSVDLGKSSLMSLVNAHARGLPLTVVAPSGFYEARSLSDGIIVVKDSPIRTARDLDGKTITVPALNDFFSIATKAWLDKHGGDSSSVHFLETPAILVGAALDAGRVDAGTLANPLLAQALATGKYRRLGSIVEGIGEHFVYSAWFGTTDYVAKNHAAVERFVRVLQRAAIYANGHHAQTIELLAKFSGADPATIARTPRVTYATSLEPRFLQPLIDAAAKYKAIPAAFDAREMISPYALGD
jgi:NitT/TauT family transport system substrate-binding protein